MTASLMGCSEEDRATGLPLRPGCVWAGVLGAWGHVAASQTLPMGQLPGLTSSCISRSSQKATDDQPQWAPLTCKVFSEGARVIEHHAQDLLRRELQLPAGGVCGAVERPGGPDQKVGWRAVPARRCGLPRPGPEASVPTEHSRADVEAHGLPLRVQAQLVLWEAGSVKGHMGVLLLLPQQVLEVAKCRLWVLDGLRGGERGRDGATRTCCHPLSPSLGWGGSLGTAQGWSAGSPCSPRCLQRAFHCLSESRSLGFSAGIP